MSQTRILVVDDEPFNLEIIDEYLSDTDLELDLVASGDQAWQMLQQDHGYDLAILDRMMPGMNGIELLRKMKGAETTRDIPVIMQTAAAAPEQVREGIQAGAYYYLVKPYEAETLLGIVRAVLFDIAERDKARRYAKAQVQAMALLQQAQFEFRTLAEIGPLIEMLSSLCQQPQLAATVLNEMLVNAVEHGNLCISYEEKKRLRLQDSWEAEVERRLTLPEYSQRYVQVTFQRQQQDLEFIICDAGSGFDWRRYLDFDPERAVDPNGRGIAMARTLGIATLEYPGCGNTVVVRINGSSRE